MNTTLAASSKQTLEIKLADLAAILTNRKVYIISPCAFVGYDAIGQERWEVILEIIKDERN